MADIALIMCDDYTGKIERRKHYIPSTLYYLKGAFEKHGMQTNIYNPYETDETLDSLANEIRYSGARAIGISASSQGSVMESLQKMCKELGRLGLPIIIGGYSTIYQNVLDGLPEVSAAVLGEGDESGPLVFEKYLNGELPHDIPGVKYRDGDQIIFTGKPVLVRDLDSITPDYGLVKKRDDGIYATLYTSRGCYNACTFCFSRFIHGKGIRAESAEKTIRDITVLAERYGVQHISFNDDDFLFKAGRIDAIAETLRKYNIVISFETRANDLLKPEIQAEILRNKDLINSINIGIESFSDSQLERWKKNVTAQQNNEALVFLIKNRIRNRPFFMFSDEQTTPEELRDNVYGLIKVRGHAYVSLFDKDETMHLNELMDAAGISHSPKFARRFTDMVHYAKSKLRLMEMAVKSSEMEDTSLACAAANGGATLLLASYLRAVNHESVEGASEELRKKAGQIFKDTISNLKNMDDLMLENSEEVRTAREELADKITAIGFETVELCPWYDVEEVIKSWEFDEVA